MNMLEPPQSYVQEDGTVPTTCPACGAQRSISSAQFNHRGGPVEVICPCGTRFTVLAEFRKAYRRSVNLQGTYTKGASAEEHGNIRIENLSMTGLGCITEEGHGIAVGDELIVHIILDKTEFEDIKVTVAVIHIYERLVGCHFKELTSQTEDRLASYLMLIP
jgi:hypothetical protein